MKVSAHRICLAAWLGYTMALPVRAAPAAVLAAAVPGGVLGMLIGYAALPLAALVALLLWRRQCHAHAELALRRRLMAESRLRACAEQTLLDTLPQLRHLILQQDGIRDNERWRIARDIHDDLGQHLLALKMEISVIQTSHSNSPITMRDQLGLLANHVDSTVKSLRCIINDLRPVALEAGLRTALERQLHEFSRINDVTSQLDAAPDAFDGTAAHLDSMVLRVVQESLSNVARHARAHQVSVTLKVDERALSMTVRDDGVGIPAGCAHQGSGLRGIADRARAVGGQFRIDSPPGGGTALSLSIPLGLLADASATAPPSQALQAG